MPNLNGNSNENRMTELLQKMIIKTNWTISENPFQLNLWTNEGLFLVLVFRSKEL